MLLKQKLKYVSNLSGILSARYAVEKDASTRDRQIARHHLKRGRFTSTVHAQQTETFSLNIFNTHTVSIKSCIMPPNRSHFNYLSSP